MTNYVCIPALPVRFEPSDRAEMVNQLLFGEQVKVLQKDKQWLKISSLHDDYQGWVDEKGIVAGEEQNSYAILSSTIGRAQGEHSAISLALGSILPDFNAETRTFSLGTEKFILEDGNYILNGVALPKSEILSITHRLQNAPYLWGGRNLMGIDCSGLTQVLFRLGRVDLPRDASQQATQGFDVPFVQDAKALDLAFFGEEENKITHVGVLLSSQQIIHASGKVRIDHFDQQGIYNADKKKYTHTLRVIKRFVHE